MLAALRGLERLRLMGVERRQPAPGERLGDLRVEAVRDRDDLSLPRRFLGVEDDLLGKEELVPGGGLDGHRSIQADREEGPWS